MLEILNSVAIKIMFVALVIAVMALAISVWFMTPTGDVICARIAFVLGPGLLLSLAGFHFWRHPEIYRKKPSEPE